MLRARVAQDIEAKVAEIAAERGADKSDIVREAVIKFVAAVAASKKLEEVAP